MVNNVDSVSYYLWCPSHGVYIPRPNSTDQPFCFDRHEAREFVSADAARKHFKNAYKNTYVPGRFVVRKVITSTEIIDTEL